MYQQLIFCLETNQRADTDWVYIRETIERFYKINNKIKLSPVYMNSKTRYQAKEVTRKIKQLCNGFYSGKTHVIMCIDVDDFESNPTHVKDFEKITTYCSDSKYDLVWFCHDIEDVYLGKRISDKDKRSFSAKFRNQQKIHEIAVDKLTSTNSHIPHTSNILNILDMYLNRV